MSSRIVAGTGNRRLAQQVAARLGTQPAICEVERFPDGELQVVVGSLSGADVYVVQPTGPPVDENLVELLLLLDACRRADPIRITAVLPYFGYARQDRRRRAGEAIGARLAADVIGAAGAERLIVLDPHTVALEGMFCIPVHQVTVVPVLSRALAAGIPEDAVVVAPDLGAAKLAERVAVLLDRPVAVVRKRRLTGATVHASELTGEVAGRAAVVVDDMISTGATIEAAVGVLLAHGARPDITVAATHGLLVAGAPERLRPLPIPRLLLTDSVTNGPGSDGPGSGKALAGQVEIISVAPLLADVIGRLHRNEPLDDLLVRT